MKLAIASLSLMLAACSAPQAPATPEAPAAPAAPEPPAAPASAPMAKRAPGQDNTIPLQVFRAFGTEPFWNVNVEDTTLTFTTPEDPEGTVMQGARQPSADGVEISGTHAGQPFVLRVASGECSDGMSDNRYTMTASFRIGDIDYRGCGEAAR
jgi:uncharacterized membrane protein